MRVCGLLMLMPRGNEMSESEITATFKNIGPIKDASLDLGDLTIIAGQNNTGKTYLVYTLYGFLKFLEDSVFRFPRKQEEVDPILKSAAAQLLENGKATIAVSEYKEYREKLIYRKSKVFSDRALAGVFSTVNGSFDRAVFEIKPNNVENKAKRSFASIRGIVINSEIKEGCLVFELELGVLEKKLSLLFLMDGLHYAMSDRINSEYLELFILSAERFGISLFYKELDFKKNMIIDILQKFSAEKHVSNRGITSEQLIEKESSRYAQPIKDNIHFTRYLSDIQKQQSEIITGKLRSVDSMMDGNYKIKNDEIYFVSKRRGSNRFEVPLHLASSSARGVSDLYFYLKHVAHRGQLLIIDEPESHLSPTNQVLMARLLVFCVNAGLKVLITTHSDYLVKEINNLIMLSGEFSGKEKFLQRNKKHYTEDDHLKPESVKAYICEKGTLNKCDIDKHTGIDMPVFDDEINKINNISNELGSLVTLDKDSHDD